MRLRRIGVGSIKAGDITRDQQFELMYDVGRIGGDGFANHEEYERAWRRYGVRLRAACGPFSRPAAYWAMDVGFIPNCRLSGYESERAALLRLQLPLTPTEEKLLARKKGEGKT